MTTSDNLWLLLFAFFLVLLNGFFVASEFAIVKLRHTRVEELRRLHGFRGRILSLVHKQLDAYLSACQLGITLASLGLGWVGEPAFARLLEAPLRALGLDEDPDTVHTIAFIFAFGTISYLHIVVGELAPKSAALRKPEAMSLWTAVPLFLFYWAMYPFIRVLNASANWMLRKAGLEDGNGHGHEVPYSHDELRMILHLSRAADDAGDSELNRMLAHTLELPQLHANDVMRPYRELVSLTTAHSHADMRRTLTTYRYSRYPYLDAASGEVLGILHFKDIYSEEATEQYGARLRHLMRPIERVNEHTPLGELLRSFRLGAPHLALVTDAEGRAVGFVTMEDVMEAIFGEITDEHEPGRTTQINREPKRLPDGSLQARGDTPLFRLERELGESIPESERLSTVNGWLMEKLEQMPVAGSTVNFGRHAARVVRVRGTAIELVSITTEQAS